MTELLALALLIAQRLPRLVGVITAGVLWPAHPGRACRTTAARRGAENGAPTT